MRLSTRSFMLASASVLALTMPATAQDVVQDAAPAATTNSDEVFVLGEITLTVDDVSGYVANGSQASKSATPIAESQQSVSVVTNQQIEDQGAQNLGQALGYTAGILGQPYGDDPRFDSPTLRGFAARDAQYVNGLRQLRYMGAPAYETYGMQQIEVLRGPSSSLYGAGAPSGIINQVQKRAQSSDFGEVGVSYGSHDSGSLYFDVNRAATDVLSWRLTGIARNSTPQIEELENQRGYLAGAARWDVDGATTIDFMASYTDDSPISPAGVPYELTQIADGKDLRDFYAGEEGWDDSNRKMYNVGIEISHDLDNGWTLSQGFRYENLDWDYKGTYVSALVGDDITRGANNQLEDTSGINLDTRLSGDVVTGAATHHILTGIDIRQYDAETTTEFFTASPLNWRDPVRGGLPLGAPWYRSVSDTTLRQIGIYAQDEIELGNWRGSLALRHDWADLDGWVTRSDVRTDIDLSDSETTGRAGVSYVFANGVMPYVSYATSFEPVNGISYAGIEIDNKSPEASTAKQWEVGVKYQPTAFNGLFTVAVYDLTQENIIDPVGGGIYRTIGEIKSRGVELEGTAEIADGWDLRAAYAYNDTEQREGGFEGNALPNAANHIASAWLTRDFGNGLRVGGGVRYIGSRFGDDANTYDMDAVTLVDLGANYTRGDIETSLNITNLGDEVYLANCGSFGCYYGEGRTVTAKVTYKW